MVSLTTKSEPPATERVKEFFRRSISRHTGEAQRLEYRALCVIPAKKPGSIVVQVSVVAAQFWRSCPLGNTSQTARWIPACAGIDEALALWACAIWLDNWITPPGTRRYWGDRAASTVRRSRSLGGSASQPRGRPPLAASDRAATCAEANRAAPLTQCESVNPMSLERCYTAYEAVSVTGHSFHQI